jgi:capsular exopolysaccharide synthesis family protein
MHNPSDNPWQHTTNKILEQDKPSPNKAPGSRRNLIDIDFSRLIRIWPWVVFASIGGFFIALLLFRYSVPQYRAAMSVNIQQKEEISIGQALFGTRDPFNDKLFWFRSPSIAKQLVDRLDLRYNASLVGFFRDKDLYKTIEWKIVDSVPVSEKRNISFIVTPAKNGFVCKYGNKTIESKWGIPFILDSTTVVVNKLKSLPGGKDILCSTIDPWSIAFNISKGLQIYPVKESNVIDISYVDRSSERAVDILNTLVLVYNESLVAEKVESLTKAIEFIDKRIEPLSRELDLIESDIAAFKSEKGFVGLSSNGVLYQQELFNADHRLSEFELQKQTIQAVENYITNPLTKDENLSLIGITDSYLQTLLSQFQILRAERMNMSKNVTEKNPNLQLLDQQISTIKKNILVQVSNYKQNIVIAESTYDKKIAAAKELVRNTPSDEKILLSKARQQNIKEQLFLLLLQKREESAVAKASVTTNTRILSPPMRPSVPISPDKSKLFALCMVTGGVLPILLALLKELINRRIVSKRQLERYTRIPILAELEYDSNSADIAVANYNRSLLTEQIRSLRANLSFYNKTDETFFIMITSSISGEGKSFISSNLAKSFALLGKRVALVEMDLRRPKLAKRFNIKVEKGVSNVLTGRVTPESICTQVFDIESPVHLYSAGPVPPNPAELIASNAAEVFRKYLDKNYDIVIIDTPPFGIVSDAQLMAHWASLTLFISRFNMTLIDQVYDINDWYQNGVFPNVALVFNAIKMKGYFGYNYGYYYYRRQKGYYYYGPAEKGDDNI